MTDEQRVRRSGTGTGQMTGQNSTLARQAETTGQNEKAEIAPEKMGSHVAKILKIQYK